MKITVRKKESEEKVKHIYIKDVESGYVFEILEGSSRNVKALKLRNNEAALLKFSAGNNWFDSMSKGAWEGTPVKILGRLVEIIVES